ncbi:CopM family metallochaperone [Microvirga flavescens]|uniref:CopM family metallochaperone n=1 Tax=Microvirga flavescens TaxID=2249811 RepID=UPI000DD901ED
MKTISLIAAGFALALAGAAQAQAPGSHSGHTMPMPAASSAAKASPSTAAYEASQARMHKDMAIPYTGDADVDFARGMIPHHQGAIDMAKIVLQYGKDPEIRKLAQDVVGAQEKEIAFLKEWLKKNGH